jgi:flagellar biosynthetic protein FliR
MTFNPNLLVANMDQLQLVFLVFLRIAGMVAMMPIFGSQFLPVQLKVGFVFFLTILLFPITAVHGAVAVPFTLGMFVLMVMKEIFVGVVVGFAASFIFAAVQFAGRIVDNEMGFTFVELVDPFSETEVTVMGQLKILVFTIFFLLFNGHYFLVLAIRKSFEVIPLGGVTVHAGELSAFFINLSSGLFVAALKLAAPVFVTLFMTSLAMGIVARTVPQINVFFGAMPVKIILGLAIAAAVFPVLAGIFKKIFEGLMTDIWQLIYLMA